MVNYIVDLKVHQKSRPCDSRGGNVVTGFWIMGSFILYSLILTRYKEDFLQIFFGLWRANQLIALALDINEAILGHWEILFWRWACSYFFFFKCQLCAYTQLWLGHTTWVRNQTWEHAAKHLKKMFAPSTFQLTEPLLLAGVYAHSKC